MRTLFEFLSFFWTDLTDWLASSERLKGSRGAAYEVDASSLQVFRFVDRKLVEFLVLCLVIGPCFAYFLGRAASSVFGFWFGQYG
jgi:hypothetical protein